jgi:hypothetical protein
VSAIDTLAATVRTQLDAIEEEAERGYLKAPEIEGWTGWDKSSVAGLPPAVIALVLREVEARRKLVAHLLVEPHHRWPGVSACSVLVGSGECNCGRDARVTAYLELLAQPYQETN